MRQKLSTGHYGPAPTVNVIPELNGNRVKIIFFLVKDLLKKTIKSLNIICEEGQLKPYEREVNISNNDVFHRLCNSDEKPLGILHKLSHPNSSNFDPSYRQ